MTKSLEKNSSIFDSLITTTGTGTVFISMRYLFMRFFVLLIHSSFHSLAHSLAQIHQLYSMLSLSQFLTHLKFPCDSFHSISGKEILTWRVHLFLIHYYSRFASSSCETCHFLTHSSYFHHIHLFCNSFFLSFQRVITILYEKVERRSKTSCIKSLYQIGSRFCLRVLVCSKIEI